MRFEFIRSANHGLSVKRACRALNVSRGGYYEHIKRGKSKAQIAREALVPFIEDAFYASNRRYGARRVAIELQKMGIMANRKTVQRIMSSRGLIALQASRKYRRGAKASDAGTNVLNGDFTIKRRNVAWCGDITYLPTREGWLYLATYLDLFSRKIVGWQVSNRIDENLVISALDSAVKRENPPEGLLVHTDRGSQYTSRRYSRELEERGFAQSFSKKGCPYDNAVMESFYRTLKRELPLDRKFETRLEARQEIFEFIELYYNTKRPHSSLGYMSPVDYERSFPQGLDS